MLGYYFAERVAEETGVSDDLNVFLRWEQLAAYARGGGNNDWVFRGTERTRKNWDASDRVRLSADAGSLILSDQKTYGLWGLYSVPSRSSGLVEGSPTRLTAEGRQFVEENYLPILDGKPMKRGRDLVDLLAKRSTEIRPKDRDHVLLNAVAKVLRRKFSSAERSLYIRHLIEGGPADSTNGGQRLLADAMKTTFDVTDWQLSSAMVKHLVKHCNAAATETSDRVCAFLGRIVTAEQLLAPCVSLFAYLLANDKQGVDDVAVSLRKHWGPGLRSVNLAALQELEPELIDASGEQQSARRWLAIAEALSEGAYVTAINHIIDHNREIMFMRGGAAQWVEVRDGKLHVKFSAEASQLPTKQELSAHWIHSYFLDSLRTVTKELEA